MESLIKIQSELKAPKNQINSFGKYKYRSCEDILEALKPLLLKHACTLTIHDEVKQIGDLIYIEATASIQKGDESRTVTAQAGIDTNRKGMDLSQTFGAASSYARKYSLNGLFLIDDTKDADATNTHENETKTVQKQEDTRPWLNKVDFDKAQEYLRNGGKLEVIQAKYRINKEMMENLNQVIKNL
jgi:aminoglycoside N3'-acetyltransferase